MYHSLAIGSSVLFLGLVAALYWLTVFAAPGSWLRGETLSSILVALLAGTFPLAFGATGVGLSRILSQDASLSGALAGGVDLVSLVLLAVALVLFRLPLARVRRETRLAPR